MKPRYIIDLDRLRETAQVARANADRMGVHLLMALKGFPLPSAFPTLAPFLDGVTASGLYESRLGALMGREVHVHAPAYLPDEIDDLASTCTHVVFNSLDQLHRFGAAVRAKGVRVGLRVNPGISSADCLKYDPCCPESRFGVLWEELLAGDAADLALVDGLHIHALCEGYSDQFAALVEKFAEILASARDPKLSRLVRTLDWVNLGGGEVINDPAFASPRACAAVARLRAALGSRESVRVYIEPSEYMVRYSGFLEAHVLDVIRREKDIAVLDISASCHATDLVLFDMKPDVVVPAQKEGGRPTILGCVSCLAGDVLGEYAFARPLEVGDTVLLGGLGCYSFAQQSWFNGIRHPDLVLRSKDAGDRVVLSWDFADYLREFHRV